MSALLLPPGHRPRTNHTGVCWLLRVRTPAAAAALLQSSPKVRFAALNIATQLVYAETTWPPCRVSAVRRILGDTLVDVLLKPTTLSRADALASIGSADWLTGDWRVGGQGARVDRLRLQPHSAEEDDAADVSE